MLAVFVDNSELSGAVKIDPSMLECQPDITEIDVSLKSEYHDYQPDFPLESKFDFIPMRNTSKNSSSLGSRRKVKNLRSNKSGSRLFQCQYCSHQANHRGNLGRHIKAIHPEAESESLRIEPIPQTSGWLYKCDFCSYENDVRTNLLRHLRLKHPKRIKQEDDNEKPSGRNRFECKDCEASFYTQNRLIKHQNREHQDKHEIICIYCQSVFSTVELMKEHCRHFHQKLGNSNRKKKKREYILCPVCGNLVQKGLMKVHIAGVHNKEKKYLCTVRSTTFFPPSFLINDCVFTFQGLWKRLHWSDSTEGSSADPPQQWTPPFPLRPLPQQFSNQEIRPPAHSTQPHQKGADDSVRVLLERILRKTRP